MKHAVCSALHADFTTCIRASLRIDCLPPHETRISRHDLFTQRLAPIAALSGRSADSVQTTYSLSANGCRRFRRPRRRVRACSRACRGLGRRCAERLPRCWGSCYEAWERGPGRRRSALQDGLELALVAAVDASPEDVPCLGGSAQGHADLDRPLKQLVQPRPATKDHVAGEFDLGHRPLVVEPARGALAGTEPRGQARGPVAGTLPQDLLVEALGGGAQLVRVGAADDSRCRPSGTGRRRAAAPARRRSVRSGSSSR